jgi:hypothetical protein
MEMKKKIKIIVYDGWATLGKSHFKELKAICKELTKRGIFKTSKAVQRGL